MTYTQAKTRSNLSAKVENGSARHELLARLPATHDDIARRAYDIYIKSACRQGRCQQNWDQAEHELADVATSAPSRFEPDSTTFVQIDIANGGPGVLRAFKGDGGITREATHLNPVPSRHNGF